MPIRLDYTAARQRFTEALELARSAVQETPDNAAFLDTLAEASYRAGLRDDAIKLEQRALELTPDMKFMHEQLARFKAGIASRNFSHSRSVHPSIMTGKKYAGSSSAPVRASFFALAYAVVDVWLNMNGTVASTRIWGDSGSSSMARAPSVISSANRPWKERAMPN